LLGVEGGTADRIRLIDDLDGTEIRNGSGQTVSFGLNGQGYEIDLTDENAEGLSEELTRYVRAGRKVSGRSSRSRRAAKPSGRSDISPPAVREWAKANKVEVSPRGRITQSVIDQFRAAGNQPTRVKSGDRLRSSLPPLLTHSPWNAGASSAPGAASGAVGPHDPTSAGRPLHDKGNLAVHLVQGEVPVLVDVGVAADHLHATDAANSLRSCSYGVAYGITEGVGRTPHDLGDPDNSSRHVVLLFRHVAS
jgi:Lsr2